MHSLYASEDQLGVTPGCAAWVNSTDNAIRPVEAEVQTSRASTIVVIGAFKKHGVRMRNARSNDGSVLPVCANVFHPWEHTVKIDCGLCWPLADFIESVSGHVVQ